MTEAAAAPTCTRTRPETASLPVIALGTLEPALEEAQASGNVRAAIPLPFELEALLDAVGAALAGRPFEARIRAAPPDPDPALREAAHVLAGAERAVMLEWLQRARAIEPLVRREDISVREFLDSVPRILNAVVFILRHAEPHPPGLLAQDPDLADRIRSHAVTRRGQGVPAEAVVAEYQVLRDVLLGRLERAMPPEQVLRASRKLVGLTDLLVVMTVAEYHRSPDLPT